MKRVTTYRVLVSICLLVVLAGVASGALAADPRQITVIFRYDDYSARSDTEFEVRLINSFQAADMPLTISVIPFVSAGYSHDATAQGNLPLPPEKGEILRWGSEQGTVEVALHGYSHQTNATRPEGDPSEFAGLPYQEQLERISEGKQYLEEMVGSHVVTFVPPWNSYDADTVRAIEAVGFHSLSAGPLGMRVADSPLRVFPSFVGLDRLQETVQQARRNRDPEPMIVVLFHPSDFVEVNPDGGTLTHEQLDALLGWVGAQGDVRVLTLEQAADAIDDTGWARYTGYQRFRPEAPLGRVAPPLLSRPYTQAMYAYPSSSALRRMQWEAWALVGLLYGGILGATAAVGPGFAWLLRGRGARLLTAAAVASTLLLVLMAAYALYDLQLYFRSSMVLVALFGLCAGMWLAWLRRRTAPVPVKPAPPEAAYRRGRRRVED